MILLVAKKLKSLRKFVDYIQVYYVLPFESTDVWIFFYNFVEANLDSAFEQMQHRKACYFIALTKTVQILNSKGQHLFRGR